MQPDVPFQFLIGAVRLIAVYYGFRYLDSLMAGVMAYQMQLQVTPDLVVGMPSAWTYYLPCAGFYLAMVVGAWFLAPFICRLSMARPAPEPPASLLSGVSWNECMIFLFGTLFIGWGVTRMDDEFRYLLPSHNGSPDTEIILSNRIRFFISMGLAGAGVLMCLRFRSLHQWMHRRAAADSSSSAP